MRAPGVAASIRGTQPLAALSDPAVADALLAAAWGVLALDVLRRTRAERVARTALGPVVAGDPPPSLAARVVVLAVTLGGAAVLERTTGRLPPHPVATLAGLALAGAGLALHLWARRTLGPSWSATIGVRAAQRVIDRGPYGAVRHPLYVAIVLLAAGSFLAHPSLAAGCLAGGLVAGVVLKMRREERMLHATLGEAYARYARRVPALWPRLGRRR